MTRPGFAHGLGPTRREYLVFLSWLAVVILSMTAMVRVPAFNLLFWPTLWVYDWFTVEPLRNSLDPGGDVRPRMSRAPGPLWDREIDG